MKLVVRWTVVALLVLASSQAAGQTVTTVPLYLWSNPEPLLSEQPPTGNHPAVAISGGSVAWALTPPLQNDMMLAAGDVHAVLRLTRTCDWGGFWCWLLDPRDRQVTVELTNGVLGVVATASVQLQDLPTGAPDEYIVLLDVPATVAAPAGSIFILTVSYEDVAGLGIEMWPRRGGNTSRIELSVFETPALQVLKTSQVFSDPVNTTVNPKSIPGAVQIYAVRVTNTGGGATDDDSLAVADAIPQNTAMYVGDVGGPASGPIAFVDGSPGSGLLYTFAGLNSDTDDLEFSNDNGATWAHDPTPDSGGYDSSITHIRVRPHGALAAAGVAGNPYFEIRFRVRVE